MPIFKGTWTDSEGVGFDADSFALQFTAAVSRDVHMWWPEGPPWDNAVPVDVVHAAGTATVELDQSANPGQWNKLGTWTFNTPTSTITIRTDGTTAHVAADAVAIVPEDDTPITEIIIDNTEAAFAGAWTETTFRPNYWPPDYRHDQNADKGNKTCTFTPTIPGTGSYHLFMWWPDNPVWDPNVPVDIHHHDGTDTVYVDQTADAGQWNLLGTYKFREGTTNTVVIRTTWTTQHVAADAIRLVPTGQVGRHQYIDNADGEPDVALIGAWTETSFRPSHWQHDYLHDDNADKGNKTVTFTATHPLGGVCRSRIHGRRFGSGARPGWYPAGPTWESGFFPISPAVLRNRMDWGHMMRWYADILPMPPVRVITAHEGIEVTGDMTPNVAGRYVPIVDPPWEGKWKDLGSDWHVWWHVGLQAWVIADTYPDLPLITDPSWGRVDVAWYGTYTPDGTAEGNCTVTGQTLNGEYHYVGPHNDLPHFFNSAKESHIWCHTPAEYWILGKTFPDLPGILDLWWDFEGMAFDGDYEPQGMSQGTATVYCPP